ncbi:hypothetical protein CCR75_008211 [Bremia lactucae]|uniref:Uncharacterized protein n=1 Tax=Bremia lactucae TaxID=4779 RepID=A0A976IGM3_BRELC|nr:hypothetical protein CCR75_008211 [Bremia lactucae]
MDWTAFKRSAQRFRHSLISQLDSSNFHLSVYSVTLLMRSFMRAIGLGGLFHRSTVRASTVNAAAAFDLSHGSRLSSIYERPQFLFFCGSDTLARSSVEHTLPKHSVLASQFCEAAAQTQSTIDHRMPVFFKSRFSPSQFADC